MVFSLTDCSLPSPLPICSVVIKSLKKIVHICIQISKVIISAIILNKTPVMDICGAMKTTEQHIPPSLEETGICLIWMML